MPYIGVSGRFEDLLGPADRFEPLTEETQLGGMSGDRHGSDEIGLIDGPSETGPQVGQLGIHPLDGAAEERPVRRVELGDDLGREVGGVTIPQIVGGAGGGQLLSGELADRLQ